MKKRIKIIKSFKLNNAIDDLKERKIIYEFSHMINFPGFREKVQRDENYKGKAMKRER